MAGPAFEFAAVDNASKKASLKDVQSAFTRRMLWSQEQYNNASPYIARLTSLCDMIEKAFTVGNSNSTIAAGTIGDSLFIATQGFTFNFSNAVSTGLASHLLDSVAGLFDPGTWSTYLVNAVTLDLGSTFSGIHAEMMIVRELVVRHGFQKAALAPMGLVMGTTTSKGCCPNCAGFMNSYGIPHTPVRQKLSGMWRHPVTLNKYMHSTVDPYDNPPKLSYDGYAPGTAEINKAGTVLRAPQGASQLKTRAAPITTPPSAAEQQLVSNVGLMDTD